jgi:Tol biopolymer transport system component/DNA-binding winged helix-turn-helix (wHTH) protein
VRPLGTVRIDLAFAKEFHRVFMSNACSDLYTLGCYTLDPVSRVLTRSGVAVNVPPKTFDLLVLMVESGGRLVSKRELMDTLWNGAFVEEANLSFQISTLRKLLGEEGRAWIEAVPKYGYRFRALVERYPATQNQASAAIPPQSAEPAVSRAPSRTGLIWLVAALGAIFAMGVAFAIWNGWRENREQKISGPLHVIPATTYPGRETHPTLSSDGSQLAFAWDGEDHKNFDIYVKVVGENRSLRLTSDPRPEFSPVWSPDGRRIAFCRDGPLGTEVVVIPALGGPERIVANLPEQADPDHPGRPNEWTDESQQLAWFPDGQFLAVVARQQAGLNAIFLLAIDEGIMGRLTSPPGQSWGDGNPSVSPDGRRLAFTRSRTKWPDPADLYVLPLSAGRAPAGEPQLATTRPIDYGGLAWTSDGDRLVFPAERGLWTVAFHKAPELLSVPGYNPSYPATAAKGDRLAFVDSSEDLDIWRVDGPAVKNRFGGVRSAPTKLIASTRDDTNPQYSPDGSRIAFTSSRAGTDAIWVSDSDGSNPVQVTDVKAETGTPRWSPDGRYLAFDSMKSGSEDIYVVPSQGGPIRRMTPESSEEDMPSWSRDGRWIYFYSDRSGGTDVWKVPASGGPAVAVTTNGGADAFEARDGKFIYYAKWGQQGIWRKPVGGGPEILVTHSGSPYYWGLFDNGICLLDANGAARPTINCLDFDSKRITTLCI